MILGSLKERIEATTRGGWIRAGIWSALYIAFVIWVAWGDWASLGWLVLLPLIVDAFTTKYINYSWWRKYKESKPWLYTVLSWVDAIVFALVAVYFINLYIFQNYQIPSSSLEKTLRVGDFLYVSKMAYGARVPQTPLSMPLVQHTMPNWLGGGKSYLDKPHWEYKRLKGWTSPKKGDIVVFNFPAGDTVCTRMQNPDYYTLRYSYGETFIRQRKDIFGDIVTRPVDRRENYVKRCVGTPGDSLRIINNVVYTKLKIKNSKLKISDAEWQREPEREGLQLNYFVQTDGHIFGAKYLDKLGISMADRIQIDATTWHFPLTQAMKEGINNLYQYSNLMGGTFAQSMDRLATSGQYLKNSLGAMAAPIINALAPAIDFVIDKIATLLNYINMLFALPVYQGLLCFVVLSYAESWVLVHKLI